MVKMPGIQLKNERCGNYRASMRGQCRMASFFVDISRMRDAFRAASMRA
ncbi:hypothetical protein [Slackia faecicanis]|nr:hypothetical protein [Slackia faecicanis]